MRKHLWWGLAGALILSLALGAWWIWGTPEEPLKVKAGVVEPISMQEDVYATGSVAPVSRQAVQVMTPGRVANVAVKVGESVQVGQTLVTLETTLVDAQVAQAKGNVEAAQTSVRVAQVNLDELRKAQREAREASEASATRAAKAASAANAARAANESNVIHLASFLADASEIGLADASESGLADSVGDLSAGALSALFPFNTVQNSSIQVTPVTPVNPISPTVIRQAEGAVTQSKGAVKQAQEMLKVAQVQQGQMTHKARLAGTVLEVNAEVGNLSPVQSPLIVVADLTQMNVEAQLNEVDAGKVKLGGKATLTSKMLGEASVQGTIVEIAPVAVAKPSIQGISSPTVGVKIRLDEVPSGLKPGFTVRIEMIVATKEGVLAVPQEALFQEGNKNYVYRIQEARLHKTEVTLGIGNDTHQEISSGLNAGDQVVLNPSKELSDGMLVTPEVGSGGV